MQLVKKQTTFSIIIVVLVLSLAHASPVFSAVQKRGGSNFAWYYHDCGALGRSPWGAIHNYLADAGNIIPVLNQMYQDGQRVLRLPLFFRRTGDTGYNPNGGDGVGSAGGQMSQYYADSLYYLVQQIRNTGFEEIEVSLHPIDYETAPGVWDCNNPHSWDPPGLNPGCQGLSQSQRDAWRQENLGIALQVKSILDSAGLLYRIDLTNEALPGGNQPLMLDYTQKFWSEYMAATNNAKYSTVGFSVIAGIWRIQNIPAVYGTNPPDVMDLHVYNNLSDSIQSIDDWFQANPLYNKGWIIGEADYNDAAWAATLADGIQQTGRTVWYLTQWVNHNCSTPNLLYQDFGNYIIYGF